MPKGPIVRDLGYNRIMRDLGGMEDRVAYVGVQSDAGSGDEGTSIAEYAFYNEYGTERTPERSFMRSSFDERVQQLMALRTRIVKLVIDGRLDPDRGASLLGEAHEGDIKRKIGSNIPPPNAPSTIAAKGSSKTLIDNGTLRGAIRYEVRYEPAGFWRRFKRWAGGVR